MGSALSASWSAARKPASRLNQALRARSDRQRCAGAERDLGHHHRHPVELQRIDGGPCDLLAGGQRHPHLAGHHVDGHVLIAKRVADRGGLFDEPRSRQAQVETNQQRGLPRARDDEHALSVVVKHSAVGQVRVRAHVDRHVGPVGGADGDVMLVRRPGRRPGGREGAHRCVQLGRGGRLLSLVHLARRRWAEINTLSASQVVYVHVNDALAGSRRYRPHQLEVGAHVRSQIDLVERADPRAAGRGRACGEYRSAGRSGSADQLVVKVREVVASGSITITSRGLWSCSSLSAASRLADGSSRIAVWG